MILTDLIMAFYMGRRSLDTDTLVDNSSAVFGYLNSMAVENNSYALAFAMGVASRPVQVYRMLSEDFFEVAVR